MHDAGKKRNKNQQIEDEGSEANSENKVEEV
jgi:hypothetical protein